MPDLIAKKSFRYAGRMLVAGDRFVANRQDARVLVAIRNAEAAPLEEPKKTMKAEVETEDSSPPSSDLDDLRVKAEAAGVDVDGRWGKLRLEKEIAAVKGRYRRRDMQVEED